MDFLKSKKKILIPLAAVLLVIVIAALVILPRPNLRIDDVKAPTKFGILTQFGIPTKGFGSDKWIYNDCIEFHDITVKMVSVDFNDNRISLTETDEESGEALVDIIEHYCDYDSRVSSFVHYKYGDAEITVSEGGVVFIFFEFK